MADDYKLHLHSDSGDPHTVDAPPDLRVGEFIADVRDGLSLTGELRIYDKDLGRDLDPRETLAESGVRSGHHLFIQRFEEPPPRARVQVPPRPVPPPARSGMNIGVITLAAVLAIAFAAGGYSIGAGSSKPQSSPVDYEKLRAENTRLQQSVSELTEQKNQLQAKLDENGTQMSAKEAAEAAAASKAAAATGKLNRTTKELAALQTQIASVQADSQSHQQALAKARAEAEEAKESTNTLRRQLQTALARIQTDDVTIARLKGDLNQALGSSTKTGVIEWRGRASKGRPIEITGNTTTEGGKVTGSLPGVPCRIFVGNPDHMKMRTPPGRDGWTKMSFEPTSSGNQTFVFFWVAN